MLTSGGTARTVLLNPTAAAGDGTSATLVVPVYANGVTDLRMLGSSTHPTLQIVPTLTSYNVDGTDTLRLFGSGFMEGSPASVTSYNFAGGTATDTVGNSGVDVYNVVSGSDNTLVSAVRAGARLRQCHRDNSRRHLGPAQRERAADGAGASARRCHRCKQSSVGRGQRQSRQARTISIPPQGKS